MLYTYGDFIEIICFYFVVDENSARLISTKPIRLGESIEMAGEFKYHKFKL